MKEVARQPDEKVGADHEHPGVKDRNPALLPVKGGEENV